MNKLKVKCPQCGCPDDVMFDAWVSWNAEHSIYELEKTFPDHPAYCLNCENVIDPVWEDE